ncbi:MAG: hypothetical protein LW692_09750, partial [Sphingobacteriales bacterium]|nr:hypothetical protein [Sphingobacteriales bacterium]
MEFISTFKVSRKIIISLVLCLSSLAELTAQSVTPYNFFAFTRPFVQISGGTIVSSIHVDDAVATQSYPIGFDFVFGGQTFTHFWPSSNMFLTLGTSSMTAPTNCLSCFFTSHGTSSALYPFNHDAYGATTGGEASFNVTGVAPFRVFTFQYLNWGTCCGATPTLSAQVILYETHNAIEYHYRHETPNTPTTRIGIIGNSTSYRSLSDRSAAPNSQLNVDVSAAGIPANNQVYQFTLYNSSTFPSVGPQVPALASFVYNPSLDTAWIQSPYTFVNTSNNLVRSYWDVVSYSSVGPNGPYTAWNAPRLCGPSPNGASG